MCSPFLARRSRPISADSPSRLPVPIGIPDVTARPRPGGTRRSTNRSGAGSGAFNCPASSMNAMTCASPAISISPCAGQDPSVGLEVERQRALRDCGGNAGRLDDRLHHGRAVRGIAYEAERGGERPHVAHHGVLVRRRPRAARRGDRVEKLAAPPRSRARARGSLRSGRRRSCGCPSGTAAHSPRRRQASRAGVPSMIFTLTSVSRTPCSARSLRME